MGQAYSVHRKAIPIVVIALIVVVAVLAVRRARLSEAAHGVYSGTIEAEESHVGSTVGGRVVSTPVSEGDRLRKGQVLVVFDSEELAASLEDALASERQARDRLDDLLAGPRVQEIERAGAAVSQARAQWNKLRAGSRPEEITEARAAVAQAKDRLAELVSGPRQEAVERARANLQAARSGRELAEKSLERIETLYKDGAVSAQALDEARARSRQAAAAEEAARQQYEELARGTRPEQIAAARQAVRQAEANLKLAEKGPRVEDIEAAEQAVRQAEASLAELQAGTRPHQIEQARSALDQAKANASRVRARLRERAVYAPKAGRLDVLSVQVGDIVAAGQPVAVIIDPGDLYMRVYVPEERLDDLRVGDRLPVTTDSGVRVTGTVEQIPSEAEFTPRNVQTTEERALQVYAVKIRIPNPAMRLRAGMPAEVRLGRSGDG